MQRTQTNVFYRHSSIPQIMRYATKAWPGHYPKDINTIFTRELPTRYFYTVFRFHTFVFTAKLMCELTMRICKSHTTQQTFG